MKTFNVSDLTDIALDFAVSKANNPAGKDGHGWWERDNEGFLFDPLNEERYSPSTIWNQGGLIIEQEKIVIGYINGLPCASLFDDTGTRHLCMEFGQTPLIAAMRCFVASKLGNTVKLHEEYDAWKV